MGGEFIEIRITHPREFIYPEPEAIRPRLLDWQVDARGGHVAWRYRITGYDQDGQPRWWLDGNRPAPVDPRRRRVPEGRGRAPRRSTVAQTAMAAKQHVQRPGAATLDRWSGVVLIGDDF
jgi:hypothetical protein